MMMDDLGGRTLRVGVATPPPPGPFRLAMELSNKIVKIVELLESQLNFTSQMMSLPEADSLHENALWNNRLVEMLQRNELDVIASGVPLLPMFRDVVDVSIPLGQDEWVTLQKQPSRWNSLSGLLSPFKMEVWLLVLLSVASMIPIMFVVYRLHLKFHPQPKSYFSGDLSDYVLFVVVSLLRQDHKLRISIHSQRALMATWWIAGILITTFYTANLTASLARPFRERLLEHPQELTWPVYKDVRWLVLQDVHTVQGFIENQNRTGLSKSFHGDLKTGRGKFVDSIEMALGMIKKGYVWFGPYEMLWEVMLANYRLSRANNKTASNACSLKITDRSYLTVEYGLIFAKNSSLTPLFNRALRLFDQSGILEHSQRVSFTGKDPCSIQGSYTARPMQLGDFLGLFCITLMGLAVATVAFVFEKICFHGHKWWRGKKDTRSAVIAPISAVCQAVAPEILNMSQYELDIEIEKLTREIDRMLLTDKEIRNILQELLYIK